MVYRCTTAANVMIPTRMVLDNWQGAVLGSLTGKKPNRNWIKGMEEQYKWVKIILHRNSPIQMTPYQ